MTTDPRAQLISDIEIALVDLKPLAQPHELAELAELLLDARDAEPEELPQVEAQFRGLERFVESRRASVAMAAVRPRS